MISLQCSSLIVICNSFYHAFLVRRKAEEAKKKAEDRAKKRAEENEARRKAEEADKLAAHLKAKLEEKEAEEASKARVKSMKETYQKVFDIIQNLLAFDDLD